MTWQISSLQTKAQGVPPSAGDEENTLVGAVVALESDGKSHGSSLAVHWLPVSPRTRRDVGKISDICCEKGCSLQELIQFC